MNPRNYPTKELRLLDPRSMRELAKKKKLSMNNLDIRTTRGIESLTLISFA